MYMRVYAFTYMRIWVDSHRIETKREGMVRMAPFISENIDLVPCMAMAFNAAIATMGFLKMVVIVCKELMLQLLCRIFYN